MAGDEIDVENLWWRYRGNEQWVLRGVSFKVGKGQVLGIMGPSGAGKTTLCLALCGLIPHVANGDMQGRVSLAGIDTSQSRIGDLTKKVGIVFQDPETQFVTMSVRDEVVFSMENRGLDRHVMNERLEKVIKAVRLEGYDEKYPYELSGGQKQRCAIAAALTLEPEILILDEPTSDLDPIGKQEVFTLIGELKHRGVTMVIVEHLSEELVKYADMMLFLDEGTAGPTGDPRCFFEQARMLMTKGAWPPQVTELALSLEEHLGIRPTELPLTLEESRVQVTGILRDYPGATTPKFDDTPETKHETRPFIRADDVHYSYPDGTRALNGVDLEIGHGEYIALIGQNGSGKTTLAKMLNGLLKPTQGRVLVEGLDTTKTPISEIAAKVGYCFQNPDHQLFMRTVEDDVAFGPRNMRLSDDEVRNRVELALNTVGISQFKDVHPALLSKGQRQRVAVATVLAMKPELIVVDEPTSGQDMRMSQNLMILMDKLNEDGKTIMIVTHNMRLVAEHCKRTIIMSGGRILADGPTRKIFTMNTLLRNNYLHPPQITQLAESLVDLGVSPNILTVEEMATAISTATQQTRQGV